jgi:hypothetical protein
MTDEEFRSVRSLAEVNRNLSIEDFIYVVRLIIGVELDYENALKFLENCQERFDER